MNFNPKQFWLDLQPTHRRNIVIGAIVLSVCTVVLSLPETEKPKEENAARDFKRSVLTTGNTRDLGIDALASKLKRVDKENEELKAQIARNQRDLQDLKDRRGDTTDAQQQLKILQGQIAQLEENAKQVGWKIEDIQDGYVGPQTPSVPVTSTTAPQNQNGSLAIEPPSLSKTSIQGAGSTNDPNYYFRQSPVTPASEGPLTSNDLASDGSTEDKKLQIYVSESKKPKADELNQEKEIELGTGSVMTGVLMNGLDAPAGPKASSNPFPVTVRIQKEAILPNLFTADVKECFVNMGGYGDLSSERAYLRGERMSCMTEDGQLIDVAIQAYAIGEDGKAGLRGKVVHRTGALLANSILAGFGSGVGQAFGRQPVPTINTSATEQYQTFNSGVLNHGISNGAGEAFERLSDYYLSLAEQIFPTIEINAGRRIDISLTGKLVLKTSKKTKS